MRVLITGGYGFIGSHVAEQFNKEGYEVHILDNLSTGKKENISFKHKSYILSITDPKCKEIFNSYQFDIVVHLAAQVSVAYSVLNPTSDADTNIVGLLNMLQLCSKYKVKKFIFSSSAAVYGDNPNLPLHELEEVRPISPYGMSKWTGEQYCKNWQEQHQLDTICFRFSNVYGPRQTNEGEGGVISIFTLKAIQNESITIHGDGNQTRDFIYVKDVAFAIYRAAQSYITGTYNLSTNTELSINELVDTLEKIHGKIDFRFTSPRDSDIYRSSLDNTAVKQQLDWVPLYSIEEGLEKTVAWAKKISQEQNVLQPSKQEQQKLPSWVPRFKPYIENIVLFIIFSVIVMTAPLPFISVFLFGVFYIITIGSIYGNKQAFLGVALSFALLTFDNIKNGREIISLLYDTTYLFQIVTFLFIGLVVGYSVQRKNEKIIEQQEQLNELTKRYDFLEEIHTDVREVKNELQFRVKNTEDSFGKIFSIIKELDDLEPEKIFTNTIKVVERIMHCEDVSIYVFNKYHSYLRLVAHSNFASDRDIQTSLKVDDHSYIQQMVQTNKSFINRNLNPHTPLMAAPIYFNQEIRAIITINNLPFENFSRYHENLFGVVSGLIQSSLSRAFEFIKLSEEHRYIEHTEILKIEKFNEIIKVKEEAKESYNMPYSIVQLKIPFESLIETSEKISKLLRETDYLGYDNGKLSILLSNTKETDLPFILNRFKETGFSLQTDEKVYQL